MEKLANVSEEKEKLGVEIREIRLAGKRSEEEILRSHQVEKADLERKIELFKRKCEDLDSLGEANFVIQKMLNSIENMDFQEKSEKKTKEFDGEIKKKMSEIGFLEKKLMTLSADFLKLQYETEANLAVQRVLSALEHNIFEEEIKKQASKTKQFAEESVKKHEFDISLLTAKLSSLEKVHSKLNYEREVEITMQNLLDQVENEHFLKLNQVNSKTGLHLIKNHFKDLNNQFTAICKKFMKPQTDLTKL